MPLALSRWFYGIATVSKALNMIEFRYARIGPRHCRHVVNVKPPILRIEDGCERDEMRGYRRVQLLRKQELAELRFGRVRGQFDDLVVELDAIAALNASSERHGEERRCGDIRD